MINFVRNAGGCLLLVWALGVPGHLIAAAQPLRTVVATNDGAAALFEPHRVLDIRVEIAPADWETLRMEHHDLLAALGPTRFDKPEPKPYKTYKADVTIDGVTLKAIGLRKRGFLGSASFQRPSLGLHFNEYEPGRKFCGLKRMSLNNNLQDASQVHQALAYRVFAAVGVPAPRCSFARVTVNGNYLGLYSHVEAVETEFLKRRFGDAGGNLYEGQLSDFRPEWVKTFERKNQKQAGDRSDLEAVVKALQSDDPQLLAPIESLVDVEEYLTYWAVESLIGHWDSYSNNGNNFFVYRLPTTRKLVFIPWGADSVFGDRDPFTRFKTPESVQARSLLPRRLYQLPATRERYRERLRQVLKTNWNEQELLAEVDRLEGLLKPHVAVSSKHFLNGLNTVRGFIQTRRAALERELTGPAPEWNAPLRKSACLEKAGTVAASFLTTWQKQSPANPLTCGAVNLSLELQGNKEEFDAQGVMAIPGNDARTADCPIITLVGTSHGGLKVQALALVIQPEFYHTRTSLKVDGFKVGGVLLEGGFLGINMRVLGLPIGTLELKDAGTNPGEAVSGRIRADIYKLLE